MSSIGRAVSAALVLVAARGDCASAALTNPHIFRSVADLYPNGCGRRQFRRVFRGLCLHRRRRLRQLLRQRHRSQQHPLFGQIHPRRRTCVPDVLSGTGSSTRPTGSHTWTSTTLRRTPGNSRTWQLQCSRPGRVFDGRGLQQGVHRGVELARWRLPDSQRLRSGEHVTRSRPLCPGDMPWAGSPFAAATHTWPTTTLSG